MSLDAMRPLTGAIYGSGNLRVNDFFPKISEICAHLNHNTLDPQRPFQATQRLAPQPPVATLAGVGRVGRGLTFAPDPQDPGVHEVDPPPPVQRVKAFDHIVWLAWPRNPALVGGVPAPSRRAISAAMVQNQASSALRKGSVRRGRSLDGNCTETLR
jgi:hypothetical protein